MRRLTAALLTALLMGSPAAVRLASTAPALSHSTEVTPSIDGCMRAIRAAILARDVNGLLRRFESNQPVFVQLSPLDRGGFLGPGPLDALVRRLLADRVPVSFDVPDVPEVPRDGTRAFVTAVWTYRSNASSTLHSDHLHLVLSHAPEHAEWLIVEMKTSTR